MRSRIYWALLGLVIEHPSYGYDLARHFEKAYGGLLPLSGNSHIYIALKTLTQRGLVEEVEPSSCGARSLSRQPRPHYQATPEGIASYRQWLIAQLQEETRHSRLVGRQLAVFRSAPEAALDVLAGFERECLEELSKTQGRADRRPTPATESPPENDGVRELVSRLTRESDRLMAAARLRWIEFARSEFSDLADPGHDEPA